VPGMRREERRGMRHPLQAESTGERVVIVGTGEWGATAFEYFGYDSPHEVVAFSAEAPFITGDVYCGLPVVPFDELATAYPAADYRAFVAVSDIQLNRVRRRLYDAVRAAGFHCVSYVSSHSFVLRNAEIGENTFVQENAALEYGVRLGDNVSLGAGTCVGHSSVIEDDCYLGPHAVVSGNSRVGRGSFLGVNCCVADGVFVGEDCVIGAGAVVLKDTKPRQVYVGNPARPTGRDSFDAFGVTSGKP
jgi:sugar O-acyltransferase (sialic acid O-acetyltransferase NeuD family)